MEAIVISVIVIVLFFFAVIKLTPIIRPHAQVMQEHSQSFAAKRRVEIHKSNQSIKKDIQEIITQGGFTTSQTLLDAINNNIASI